MYLYPLAEVAICYIGDDGAYFLYSFAESHVCLSELRHLPLDLPKIVILDVLHCPRSMLFCLQKLVLHIVDPICLALDLLCLLFDMVSEIGDVLFCKRKGIPCQQVRDTSLPCCV